jgi:hypothetical protein
MSPTKRKQSRWKPGMTYAVPLIDGSFGIAQAGEAMWPNIVYVALFADRCPALPTIPVPLDARTAIALSATWRQALNRGEWLSLTIQPEVFRKSDFPNERFAASGYVGASHSDAGILTGFLCAYHGLGPWNVMFEPGYYDKFLRPGVNRPTQAVVLDEAERQRYRREVMGIDA